MLYVGDEEGRGLCCCSSVGVQEESVVRSKQDAMEEEGECRQEVEDARVIRSSGSSNKRTGIRGSRGELCLQLTFSAGLGWGRSVDARGHGPWNGEKMRKIDEIAVVGLGPAVETWTHVVPPPLTPQRVHIPIAHFLESGRAHYWPRAPSPVFPLFRALFFSAPLCGPAVGTRPSRTSRYDSSIASRW